MFEKTSLVETNSPCHLALVCSNDASMPSLGQPSPTASMPSLDQPSPTGPGGYTYYVEAGPWGACNAECGGGRRVRTVQCLRIGLGGTQALSIDQCPMHDIPSASEPCNTLACPSAHVEVVTSQAVLACYGPACAPNSASSSSSSNSSSFPLQILCRSSVG